MGEGDDIRNYNIKITYPHDSLHNMPYQYASLGDYPHTRVPDVASLTVALLSVPISD